MKITSERVQEVLSLRASGHVRRWHTIATLGDTQTVSSHSAQALSLLLLLHPSPSVDLIKAVLWHDSAERVVGDVPAPVRRANAVFSDEYEREESRFFGEQAPTAMRAMLDLSDDDKRWLKAVDTLELLLYCYEQVMLGNSHFRIIAKRARSYLKHGASPSQEFTEFVESLGEEPNWSFA